MKFITVTGGLGNQMFGYAFCLNIRTKKKKSSLFMTHKKDSKAYGHQGYELEKIFSIKPFEETFSKLSYYLLYSYNQIIRIFPNNFKPFLFKIIGIHTITVPENFIYYPDVFNFNHNHELFKGTWQSELYFEEAKDEVRKNFTFNESLLSINTITEKKQIRKQNAISIHIRRDDYLSSKYVSGFMGICTKEYYLKAIEYVEKNIESPVFYIFTDDKKWVNENFKIENAVYVNFNSGKDSWQDMYLMSQCKHNIIANSSFSWWGAWLNSNPEKIVIAPKKWWNNFDIDDVVPKNWIRL